MPSARYTSLLSGLPRRIPPWSQIQLSHRLMGGAILVLMLLVLFLGHERYEHSGYRPPPYGGDRPPPPHGPSRPVPGTTLSLAERIALSENLYQVVLDDRHEFINSLGGPSHIAASGGSYWVLWDFFLPSFDCQHYVERIGRLGDGGKWICGMDLIADKASPVIYSFGVSDDSSFEAALLERAPRAQVYGYDYSVNSWGPQIENNPELKGRAHFHKWAVGPKDSHGPEADPNFQVYTLDTLMKLNEHTWIDILKIDVEGAEFDVLRGFCNYYMERGLPLPFGQLQVEIHAWDSKMSFATFLEWFELLESAGLRPFRAEPNLVYVNILNAKATLSEYAFVNIRGGHELITDA
ncbi:hypothetical protein DACRYDRAFT_21995 [Dacryopinax primogenitus]|uniref:Methyltransferase domain-containing protein n=1 Tax=Dacryopinax primogenitus (strain DJM 731) TaxID=1858805 RepID=M5G8V7_DACPD|nr:uncharacterized protein DACRYDRAFT_21995 [Dacryopinax primogenitus]EJU02302.1 hypothetical protein DACRYDRAFT_21995 [Dacryopinax primogenitus]